MRPFFILYPERTVVPGITSLENSSFFFPTLPLHCVVLVEYGVDYLTHQLHLTSGRYI